MGIKSDQKAATASDLKSVPATAIDPSWIEAAGRDSRYDSWPRTKTMKYTSVLGSTYKMVGLRAGFFMKLTCVRMSSKKNGPAICCFDLYADGMDDGPDLSVSVSSIEIALWNVVSATTNHKTFILTLLGKLKDLYPDTCGELLMEEQDMQDVYQNDKNWGAFG